MIRSVLLFSGFLVACSPEGGKSGAAPASGKSGVQPAPDEDAAAVPFKQLGWDSESSRFTLEGKPFSGRTTEFYKASGRLKARYHLKDGVYHGLVEEWYDNGQQKTKTSYLNGKHEGDNFYWNSDGTLQVHKVWKDDVLVSETPGGRP